MPQLDIVSYFSQLFWFFIFYISIFVILSKIVLPKLHLIISSRQFLTQKTTLVQLLKVTKSSATQRKFVEIPVIALDFSKIDSVIFQKIKGFSKEKKQFFKSLSLKSVENKTFKKMFGQLLETSFFYFLLKTFYFVDFSLLNSKKSSIFWGASFLELLKKKKRKSSKKYL